MAGHALFDHCCTVCFAHSQSPFFPFCSRLPTPVFLPLFVPHAQSLPLPVELRTAVDQASLAAQVTRRTIASSSRDGSQATSFNAPASANLPPTSAELPSSREPTHVIESRQEALALLRSQPVHYVVASLAGRTMLLHARDLFTLPRLRDVQVGDVLELDRVHEVGSRDYTFRAQDPMSTRSRGPAALMRRSVPTSATPDHAKTALAGLSLKESQSWAARLRPGGLAHVGAVLDKEAVRVRCTVVEHTKGPMEFIVKKKRRKGYKRTIRHKQTYTRLRVEGIQIGPDVARGTA